MASLYRARSAVGTLWRALSVGTTLVALVALLVFAATNASAAHLAADQGRKVAQTDANILRQVQGEERQLKSLVDQGNAQGVNNTQQLAAENVVVNQMEAELTAICAATECHGVKFSGVPTTTTTAPSLPHQTPPPTTTTLPPEPRFPTPGHLAAGPLGLIQALLRLLGL
jgi:hypothetical protein